MPQYRITKLAQRDLEEIWNYTANEWSLDQAEKYLSGILLCLNGIADGRIKGKPIDAVQQGYKKALFAKHYIFYRLAADNIIEIIRVLHVRMDIENRL